MKYSRNMTTPTYELLPQLRVSEVRTPKLASCDISESLSQRTLSQPLRHVREPQLTNSECSELANTGRAYQRTPSPTLAHRSAEILNSVTYTGGPDVSHRLTHLTGRPGTRGEMPWTHGVRSSIQSFLLKTPIIYMIKFRYLIKLIHKIRTRE